MVPASSARLLEAVGGTGLAATEKALALGRLVLAPRPGAGAGGRSYLNHDGTPLQVCLTSGASGVRTRVLGDPAWHVGDPAGRWKASRAAADDVLAATAAPCLRALCGRSLDASVTAAIDSYTRGVLWLAAGLEGGTAVYVDTHPWGDRDFERARAWAGSVLPDATAACAMLANLEGKARIVSVGVEGRTAADARAKIYLRFTHAVRLDVLGIPLLRDPSFGMALTELVGPRRARLGGLVLSLGFSTCSGILQDAKVDLCGHCVPRTPARWQALVDRLTDRLDLPPLAVEVPLRDEMAEVAFVGVGIQVDGSRRLNVYLKPVEAAPQLSGVVAARESLRSGVRALLELQQADGRFSDYELPVGSADGWVTAFAGLALAGVRDDPTARAGAARAGAWLSRDRPYREGFGYNGRTGPDTDSTGFALRLAAALGHPPAPADVAFLEAQWVGEGFRTYARSDAWGASHACVTAAAGLALVGPGVSHTAPDLRRVLEATRLPDGTWPTYWWRRRTYSTWHHLLLERQLGVDRAGYPVPAIESPDSAFEAAWAAGVAGLVRHPAAADLLDALVSWQRTDGSWPGSAELRVTDLGPMDVVGVGEIVVGQELPGSRLLRGELDGPYQPLGGDWLRGDLVMATASAVTVLTELAS